MRKEIKIEKKVINGSVVWTMSINGEKVAARSEQSQELTGTTGETGDGVFEPRNSLTFNKGNRSRHFNLPALLDADTPAIRLENIIYRIEKVREWVADCKKKDMAESGTAVGYLNSTIKELMTRIETLEAAGVKRDKAGKFTK